MPLQFSGGKGFLIPFNWFSTKCMRQSRPQCGSAAGSILPGTHGEGADRNDTVFNRDGVPAVETSMVVVLRNQPGTRKDCLVACRHSPTIIYQITTDNYW